MKRNLFSCWRRQRCSAIRSPRRNSGGRTAISRWKGRRSIRRRPQGRSITRWCSYSMAGLLRWGNAAR